MEDNNKKAKQNIKNKVSNLLSGNAAILRGKCKSGTFILIAPHPEQTVGLEQFTKKLILSTIKKN